MTIYQHDVLLVKADGEDAWKFQCKQCGFLAEYDGKNLTILSMGDETARHKGIHFELCKENAFIPVYLVEQIDEIIRKARGEKK